MAGPGADCEPSTTSSPPTCASWGSWGAVGMSEGTKRMCATNQHCNSFDVCGDRGDQLPCTHIRRGEERSGSMGNRELRPTVPTAPHGDQSSHSYDARRCAQREYTAPHHHAK